MAEELLNDEITVSTRMKAVRYMRKWKRYSKPVYARKYQLESFEKEAGNLPGYHNLGHKGLDNGTGWAIQGFIEDRHGHLLTSALEPAQLRHQPHEAKRQRQ
jgi:hypothetical protein